MENLEFIEFKFESELRFGERHLTETELTEKIYIPRDIVQLISVNISRVY